MLLMHSCQSRAFRFRALPVASKSWRRFSNRYCHCRTYCSSTGFGLFRLTEPKPLGTHDLICCHTASDNVSDMDVLVTGRTRNTNVIMVCAWMLWLPHALGTRTLLCFEHGCSGSRTRWEHESYCGLGMNAQVTVCSGNMNVIIV